MKKLGLLTLIAAFFSTSAIADTQTRNFLMRQLGNRGPSLEKVQAIDALRVHLGNSQVRRTLENLISNSSEDKNARLMAVRVLSLASNTNSTTLRALKRAHNGSNDITFRAAVLRSFYRSTLNDRDLYSTLTRNLNSNADLQIKLASAYGLKDAAGRDQVSRALVSVLNNPSQNTELRIAVLKSLYMDRADNRLQQNIRYLAANRAEPASLRAAAIRFSKTFNISSRSRNQALQLANGIDLPEVKAAAYDALTFRLDEKDIIWLNLTVDPRNGQYRDALDHLHQGGHIAVPTTGNAGHNL